MSDWQSMTAAPKDGTSIILAAPSCDVWGNCRWVKKTRVPDRWESSGLGAVPFIPVAWMPMPSFNPAMPLADPAAEMSAPDYGEPWKNREAGEEQWIIATNWNDDAGDIVCNAPFDAEVSASHWPERSERIVQCVNACAGMADPAAEIAKLNAEIAELREWKRQQLEVESQWDCQKIGRMLGVPLGANIREHIEPSVTGLLDRLANQDAEIAKLREALNSFDAIDQERNDALKVCMNLLETMHFNRRNFKVDAYTKEIEAAMTQIKTCYDPHAD